MTNTKSNIVLIGMPGAGKSTVGIILAKNMAKEFIDTDIMIQTVEKRPLQEILDSEGHMALRAVEERILMTIDCHNSVISTGGSAAYSKRAMEHLREYGTVVFLHLNFEDLLKRIHNFETRGIAKREDQTFEGLYHERYLLYTKYADITIQCCDLNQEEVAEAIQKEVC